MTRENFYTADALVAFECTTEALMNNNFEILKANIRGMTIEARKKAGLQNHQTFLASIHLHPSEFKTITVKISFYRGGLLGIRIPISGGLYEEETLMTEIKKTIKRKIAWLNNLPVPLENANALIR